MSSFISPIRANFARFAGLQAIVAVYRTVSSRLRGFSLNTTGVQFNPSMSRTRKATHRTRFKNGFCTGFIETLF